ncbi:MAG: hypothetical protein Q9160_000102 [Pyrenula sp. 1 TL-2023]
MLPSTPDCDECVPGYLRTSPASILISSLPFLLTFFAVSVLSQKKISALVSDPISLRASFSLPGSPLSGREHGTSTAPKGTSFIKRTHAIAFSLSLGLSAVLTELLLCEISNSFNPTARKYALRVTVGGLLILLIVVVPLLEIHSLVQGLGWNSLGRQTRLSKLAWLIQIAAFSLFLFGFWQIGYLLPQPKTSRPPQRLQDGVINACLERLGVVGVALMALLSGFAAVSSIWQDFGARPRPVTEADIARKANGLTATRDLIATKKSRIRALELKRSEAAPTGFWKRTLISTFRPSAESQELKTLELEISGLETMASSLELSHSILSSRRSAQLHATTPLGRLNTATSYIFSCYCIYRIVTTSLLIPRRLLSPSTPSLQDPTTNSSPSTSDPVTTLLSLIAQHIYPPLNQEAWAQQISFLLSGAILLASFPAVLQTFHLLARFAPGVFQAARSNIALLVSQVCGMYVISSALMLRAVLPGERVGRVIEEALGGGVRGAVGGEMSRERAEGAVVESDGTGALDPRFVDLWFKSFFMVGVLVTALGIWLGRKLGGEGGEWGSEAEAWDQDVEMGKRL